MNTALKIVFVIGLIGVAFGAYAFFTGQPFGNYFTGLFSGTCLIGVAYLSSGKQKNEKKD